VLPTNHTPLTIYRYDALDRLASLSLSANNVVRHFYQKSRLAIRIEGSIRYRTLQTNEHMLAQYRLENGASECALLATDQQGSVIADLLQKVSYAPYGVRHPAANPENLPGFNGQPIDKVTGYYLLGNGYRAFNPVLMRFNSPDSLGPFEKAGLNAYAYCKGDPINSFDPDGHLSFRSAGLVIKAMGRLNVKKVVSQTANAPSLLQRSFKSFSGNTLRELQNTDYRAVITQVNERVGADHAAEFLSKAKGSWAERTGQAFSGQGRGFLPREALPFEAHHRNFESTLGIIKHLRPKKQERILISQLADMRTYRNRPTGSYDSAIYDLDKDALEQLVQGMTIFRRETAAASQRYHVEAMNAIRDI